MPVPWPQLYRLESGTIAQTGPISLSFFRAATTMPLLTPPPIPGGANYAFLYDRVMECLGSETNTENFALALRGLNNVKTDVSLLPITSDFPSLPFTTSIFSNFLG